MRPTRMSSSDASSGEAPRIARPAPAAGPVSADPLFSGDAPATDDHLYDLRMLRQTLEEILTTGSVARRPRRGERTAADGLVHEPLTPAEAARWTSMVGEVRAEEARVSSIIEVKSRLI